MAIIFGTGGCAKEVEWLINDINNSCDQKRTVDFFVDKVDEKKLFVGKTVISEDSFFYKFKKTSNLEIYVAIANPYTRNKIVEKIEKRITPNVEFNNLIHPNVILDFRGNRFKSGLGNIICASCIIMPDVALGNFNYIGLNTTIGHDTSIDNYVSIFPGVQVAGHVNISSSVSVGTGATIIENINICSGVVIGAGAVVVKNITEPGLYVGVPAKKIK